METFTDSKGREWGLSVTCEAIDRARSAHKIDILEAGLAAESEDPRKAIEYRLTADPVLFAGVLWCFLDPEPAAEDYPAYNRGLTGEALTAARAALWADLVNFTPSPEKEVRAATLAKMTSWLEAGWKKALSLAQDPRLDQLLASEQEKLDAKYSALLEQLGSGPASAD
jgi:hypothetical protein